MRNIEKITQLLSDHENKTIYQIIQDLFILNTIHIDNNDIDEMLNNNDKSLQQLRFYLKEKSEEVVLGLNPDQLTHDILIRYTYKFIQNTLLKSYQTKSKYININDEVTSFVASIIPTIQDGEIILAGDYLKQINLYINHIKEGLKETLLSNTSNELSEKSSEQISTTEDTTNENTFNDTILLLFMALCEKQSFGEVYHYLCGKGNDEDRENRLLKPSTQIIQALFPKSSGLNTSKALVNISTAVGFACQITDMIKQKYKLVEQTKPVISEENNTPVVVSRENKRNTGIFNTIREFGKKILTNMFKKR